MTTPDERTRAVLHTAEFLGELMSTSATQGVPDAVREEARRLLRHYPLSGDMDLTHAALPQWWGAVPSQALHRPKLGGDSASGACSGPTFHDDVGTRLWRRADLLMNQLREVGERLPPGSELRATFAARLGELCRRFAPSEPS